MSTANFPYFTCRYIDVSCCPEILTMHMTHVGEAGFVFYIPNEFAGKWCILLPFPRIEIFFVKLQHSFFTFTNKFAVEIYDSILEAGQEYGILNCGYFAMRALRVEKFYAFWGQDLDSYTVPSECGRLFRTKVIRISIQTRILVRSKISYIHISK